MAENVLIALAGGVLGLSVAVFAVSIFSNLQVPGDIPVELTFQLDARVVAFTALVSMASAFLFGLIPSLRSTKTDLVPALKSGDSDQVRRRWIGRNALVTVQVAGSLVLLVAATQLYRGFAYALAGNHGFRTDHLITMRFDPALAGYTPVQTEQFYKTLINRATEVPGVKSAGLTYAIPMTSNIRQETVIPENYQFPRGKETLEVFADTVDHHYFDTFGVKILQGHGFRETDRANAPQVVIVNQAFANRYLDSNPIGKRLRLKDSNGPWVEIVGMTATGKYLSIVEPPIEFLYLPLGQHPESRMTLLAESFGDPAALAGPLREMVRSLDSNLPLLDVRTMSDLYEQRSVKVLHLISGMVGLIGLAGLVLALVGLYAVVSYQVGRRTREFGIRMALGADRLHVMRIVLKQAAVMALIGVAIGTVVSFIAGRGLSAGLGVPTFDPLLFTGVPLGLLLTTLLAAAIPARRAARVDPMRALRQD
jgi:predicted permease